MMASVDRFEIVPPDKDGTIRLSVTDSDGKRLVADISQGMLLHLAREIPRLVTRLATQFHLGPDADPDVQLPADLVPMKGAEVNTDLLWESVLLAVDDPHGIRVAWQLTPALAEGLGKNLVKHAKRLRPQKARH